VVKNRPKTRFQKANTAARPNEQSGEFIRLRPLDQEP